MGYLVRETADGSSAFHIDDEEAVIVTLPPFELVEIAADAMRVRLTCCDASLLLPAPEQASAVDVPDERWHHPHWAGGDFAGEISGFLDDRTDFWAQVRAATAASRDHLLSVLSSLQIEAGV